jgi:hypothetical protein
MPKQILVTSQLKNIAGFELNALVAAQVLPLDVFQGTRLRASGTPIYDITGEVLFHRIPIIKGNSQTAFVDVAVHAVFNSPILAVSYGQLWDANSIIEQATQIARKQQPGLEFDKTRFVAYSYPKLAVQFLRGNSEVLLLEWGTWQPVPLEHKRSQEKEPPSNFERWSLVETISAEQLEENERNFRVRINNWLELEETIPRERKFKPEFINPAEFARIPQFSIIKANRDLHYSTNNADHTICFELRGQITNVWCVAASVQMLLDFYRYNYDQVRLATELGLGTLNNPNGLPYSRSGDVVTVLQNLTNNALKAHMNVNPNWAEFVSEISANRPLISFIPGHSRAVAGYTETKIFGWYLSQGLVVFDPWPPTNGVITRWENFANMSYYRTFTAHVL